jgi:hypothetical protein
MTGRVADGGDQQVNVALVEAGDAVAEVDGDAAGEAGCEPEDPSFAFFSELSAVLVTC